MRKFGRKAVALIVLIVVAIGLAAVLVSAYNGAGSDTIPPYVVSTYPGNGSSGIPTNVRVHATFSEPMDPGSITTNSFTLSDSFGSFVTGDVSYANKSATFIPFNSLSQSTNYIATVYSNVRDSSGNSMNSKYSWKFTTGTQ